MSKLNENFSIRKNAEILFNKRKYLSENISYDSSNPTLGTGTPDPAMRNTNPSYMGYTTPTGQVDTSRYNREVPTKDYKEKSTSTKLPSVNDPEYDAKMREINERLYKKRNDAIMGFRKTIMDARNKYAKSMKEISDKTEEIKYQRVYGDNKQVEQKPPKTPKPTKNYGGYNTNG